MNMNYLCCLMQLCETSKGVIEQFMLRHPNVKVSVVSIKESRIRYEGINKEREEYRDRWKKKK